jgi:glycosyltransferase involved in cell wall biosynthesis
VNILNISRKSKVVFVFDRVMHYHKDTFSQLEQELEVNGYEFILLSSRDKPGSTGRAGLDKKLVKNHLYFRLGEWNVGTFSLRHQYGLLTLIHKIKPAIVVSTCHSGTLSEWCLFFLKKRLGFRHIAWQCGYEYNPGRLKRWVLKKFVPKFDHHLAYHTNAKHYAISYGARCDQVTIMHNTINETAISCIPKQIAQKLIAKRHPIVAGKKIILYVGAVLEEKRLDVVFEALDILGREDLIFLLVGDGRHLDEIRKKYGHRNDLIILGRIVDGVGPYFDAADVFVLPGTGGLAINEAMAHSVAVISGYADGSADDLVIDGINGFRLKEGSATEMAVRLSNVLSGPFIASVMGEAGRQMIHGDLSFKRFIERVVSVLTGARN